MRGPSWSRLGRSERSVSAPLGVGLMLVIGVLGTTTVVALGGAALTDLEHQAQTQRAEQAITMFDSQSAKVALSDPAVQTVSLGDSGNGVYRVDPDAGQISIVEVDCDDDGNEGDSIVTGSPDNDDDAYILPPTDLGAVVYENGDTTMAYQGGGVWRRDGGGRGVMVSPPEFHYRGATLTLPIIETRGDGDVSGPAQAVVRDASPDAPPTAVFPNSSQQFPDYCEQNGTTETFDNPATDGSIMLRIQSDYAKAWGDYFDQRTQGKVSYPAPDTVQLELISLGQIGQFEMPGEGSSVSVAGANGGHAVPEFSITIRPDDADSADFSNLQWSMYADEGDQQFEIHLTKSGSGGCSGGSTGITADVSIYYSTDNGNTYHGWHGDDAYHAKCADLNGDSNDEIYFDITFVDNDDGDDTYGEYNSSDPELTYQSLSSSDLEYFNPGGATLASPTLGGHGAVWESVSPHPSPSPTTLTTDQLINHYFAELPDRFDLTVDDKGSDTVNEATSSGVLRTTGSGRYVTYLHVTENEVTVELH